MFSDPTEYAFAGEAHSMKVEKILYKEKSDYQEVLVFEVRHFQLQVPLCRDLLFVPLITFSHAVPVICSHHHMGKCLCLMALFS